MLFNPKPKEQMTREDYSVQMKGTANFAFPSDKSPECEPDEDSENKSDNLPQFVPQPDYHPEQREPTPADADSFDSAIEIALHHPKSLHTETLHFIEATYAALAAEEQIPEHDTA